MKKTIFAAAAAVLFALAALPLFAEPASDGPSLEQVAELLAKEKVVHGMFKMEKSSAASKKVLNSNGFFVISSDNGIIWKTLKPVKGIHVMARDFSVSMTPSGKRTKMDASENPIYMQMARLTCALWTNDLATLKELADVEFKSDEKGWQLEIFPKDETIKMLLDKILVAGYCVEDLAVATQITTFLKNGSRVSYYMANQVYGGGLFPEEIEWFKQ